MMMTLSQFADAVASLRPYKPRPMSIAANPLDGSACISLRNYTDRPMLSPFS